MRQSDPLGKGIVKWISMDWLYDHLNEPNMSRRHSEVYSQRYLLERRVVSHLQRVSCHVRDNPTDRRSETAYSCRCLHTGTGVTKRWGMVFIAS